MSEEPMKNVDTILPRTKVELTQQSMNAWANQVRRVESISAEKLSQMEWIAYFDAKILDAATVGKTEVKVDAIWVPNFTTTVGALLKIHYERQGFKFDQYQNGSTARVWVEW